jgi:arylsulfatase A
MTDDQGWGDIHSHGNQVIQTPTLDKLASSGARFDRFFVSPYCSPTRASLLTGRYYLRTGVHGVTRGYETMRAEEITIAEIFKDAGYATGCFGKWHNGAHFPQHPNAQGFEEFFGFCAGHWNNYFNTRLEHNGEMVLTEGFITDVLTDAAIEFIEKNRNRPFFCYVPYNAPHAPWQVPEEYYQKYERQGMSGKLACAYGMVENLDDNILRLLEKLEALDLTRETIVVFLTDNGPNTDRYNGGMKGRKSSLHEGGVRVPLFIRWPGRIAPGIEIDRIAAHIDLLPTLMELSGIEDAGELALDGVSLVPLLKEQGEGWKSRMLFSNLGGSEVTPVRGAVRTQQWRAVRYGEWELYDMTSDPGQERDLAQARPELVKELGSAYEKWFEDVTRKGFEPIPISVGFPERPEVVLPGHEAFLHPAVGEGISYHGEAGYANDWIDNWEDTAAYPYWDLDVRSDGPYEVTLMYVCAEEDLGSSIRVEIGTRQIEGMIEKAHNPDPIPSPDYVPRGEVYEKVWAPLRMGTVELKQGRTRLKVRALSIKGSKVMELKSVILRRL